MTDVRAVQWLHCRRAGGSGNVCARNVHSHGESTDNIIVQHIVSDTSL